MALPRLPPRLEYSFVRTICGLPPRVQRLLVGAPRPRIDGQVLASDIHTILRLAELVGDTSVTEGGPPERARAEASYAARVVGGRPLPMERVESLDLPGPECGLPARLYVPPQPRRDPGPLVVFFHGGGWVIGDLDTHDGVCRFLAANAGVRVLSVEYRLAPEHVFPAAIDDALAAFRWAHENAAGLGADPDRLAVAGDSAGGHISAGISILARDEGGPQPAMQVLIYPVTDAVGDQESRILFADGFLLTKADMDWFEAQYIPEPWMAADPRVSILRADDLSGLPPAYVVTAGFDPLRDEGEAYARRLREAGVPVALRRHPGLIHGFAHLTDVSRTARAATSELAGAIRMGLA